MQVPVRRTLQIVALGVVATCLSVGAVAAVEADDTPEGGGATAGAPQPSASSGPRVAGVRIAPAERSVRLGKKQGGKWPILRRTAHPDLRFNPVRGEPAQQLASATMVQNVAAGTISATVKLKAAPTLETDAEIYIAFGKLDAAQEWCIAPTDATVVWNSFGLSVEGLERNGATMVLHPFPSPSSRSGEFDCAFAETWRREEVDAEPYQHLFDALITNRLTPTYDVPRLAVKAPKTTRVTPGRRTVVKVKVRNKNPRVAAPGVKVMVKGKGIHARKVKVGKIKPGRSEVARVRIRATRGHASTATITVTTKNVTRTAKLRLR